MKLKLEDYLLVAAASSCLDSLRFGKDDSLCRHLHWQRVAEVRMCMMHA